MTDPDRAGRMKMYERELKLGLDARGVDVLRARASKVLPAVRQVNCFLDTSDGFLRALKFGFRVREEGKGGEETGAYLLTIKGPRLDDGPLSVRREEECVIDPGLARRMSAEGVKASELPGLAPVGLLREVCGDRWDSLVFRPVLTFVNERTPVLFEEDGLQIHAELDRTEYDGGKVFYEFEAEFASDEAYRETEPRLKRIFASAGVAWKLSDQSKFARGIGLKSPA